MLQLSGNSETAFAERNSIIIAPVVYAEWNYNTIYRPYVITSSSAGPVSTSFDTLANWSATKGGSAYFDTLSGFTSDVDPTASAIGLYSPNSQATFSSGLVSLPSANNAYYKLVFYIKADHINVYSSLNMIPGADITSTPNVVGSASTLYYRVTPVNSHGKSVTKDLDALDVVAVPVGAGTSSVYHRFDTNKYKANAFHVYRGTSSSFLTYVNTVPLRDIKIKTFSNMTNYNTASLTIESAAQLEVGEQFIIKSKNKKHVSLNNKSIIGINGTEWRITSISGNNVVASLVSPTTPINKTSYTTSKFKYFESVIRMLGLVDFLSVKQTSRTAPSIRSTQTRIFPSICLYNGSNIIETPRILTRVYENEFADSEIKGQMVEIDGVNYKKIEILFGSTEQFNAFRLDIDVDSSHVKNKTLIYRPQVYKIDEWKFNNNQYYPLESVFNPFRPGEAALHPYLSQQNPQDLEINTDLLTSNTVIDKPSSFAVSNPDRLFQNIYPYKQLYDTTLNNVFKYYIGPATSTSSYTSIRAQYNSFLNVNKIVVKGIQAFSNLTTASGTVVLLTPTSSIVIPFSPGSFNNMGLMTLYYNGARWSNSRIYDQTYPAKLTDSGALQNVAASVSGIILNITNITPVSTDFVGKNLPLRAHIVEISPRLELDISTYIQEITVNKSMDNSDSAAGFPLGYINANSGTLTLNNVPVYKNNFPHTIFESFSENATFSRLLRQNTKLTCFLRSPASDFTDFIPLLTMYTDEWNATGTNQISLDLFDGAQNQLMTVQTPDYLSEYQGLFQTITDLLDASGFSDYDYDGLKRVLKNKNTDISHFWTDRKNQTVLEALKALFVAHQIGAAFDEYGILRFTDLDKVIHSFNDNSINPNIAVTDITTSIIGSNDSLITYIPNIIKDSYTETTSRRVGKISLQYTIPQRAYTDQVNISGKALVQVQPHAAWESPQAAVIKSFAHRSVTSSQKYFYSNPDFTVMKHAHANPRYTLGDQQGMAFLGGELIGWTGFEYKFTPIIGQDSTTISPAHDSSVTVMISGGNDISNTISDMTNMDDRVNQVNYDFTGNVLGITRGLRNTSVRNHLMYDDVNPPTGFFSSSAYFKKGIITGRYTTSNLAGSGNTNSVTFDKNIATFTTKKQKVGRNYPIFVSPLKSIYVGDYMVPTAASSFNYFSFVFQAPNLNTITNWNQHVNHKQVELGIYIDTAYGKLMFNLGNDKNHTYLKPDYDAGLGDVYCPYVLVFPGKGSASPTYTPQINTTNVFDGHDHRFSVLFSNTPDFNSPSQPDKNNKMTYSYCTFFVDGKRYGPYHLQNRSSKAVVASPNAEFGFYVKNIHYNLSGSVSNEYTKIVNLKEIYAARWASGNGHEIDNVRVKHHWESKQFLDNLVVGHTNPEPPYYYWGPNVLTGVKFYDNQDFTTSPMVVKSLFTDFTGYGTGTETTPYPTLGKTSSKSVQVSRIDATPFRARFAVVNTDNQIVYLATNDGKVSGGTITPMGIVGLYNRMTDPIVLEKIIDPSAVSNSIVLNTSWIQSEKDAQNLFEKINLMANTFNSEINVTIFGNPLVQIGDYVQFIFSVKKIGYDPEDTSDSNQRKLFFVKSVSHTYNEGLDTNLVLKPMFNMPQ